MAARLNSDLEKAQAGDFTPVDNLTQVICEDNAPRPCATGLTFIEHTSAGTRNGTRGSATFQFDWTPPAAGAGPVTFYAAGNAANGDGNLTGDFIYTTSVQLAPVTSVAPVITAGNIVSAATSAVGPLTANSWVTIYGTNLSATTRGWSDGDFLTGGIPFSIDGVSVILTLFGAPRLAYVGYVSPTQINFLLPSDEASTATTVQVKNAAGISAAVPITIQSAAPQLFTLDGKSVWGTHSDGTFLGKAGVLPTVVSTPAAPGETVIIYGTGMGAASPALIPGTVPQNSANLATTPLVSIGGAAAKVISASVVAGSPGLYQIAVQVPTTTPDGDAAVVVQVGTASSVSTILTVQK